MGRLSERLFISSENIPILIETEHSAWEQKKLSPPHYKLGIPR